LGLGPKDQWHGPQKPKPTPVMTSFTKNLNTNPHKFFNRNKRLSEFLEGLNSSLALLVGKLWLHRVIPTKVALWSKGLLWYFVHSHHAISNNIPFVIQHNVLYMLANRHDSPQTYITAVGGCFLWRMQTSIPVFLCALYANVRIYGIAWRWSASEVCCMFEYNWKKQSTYSATGEILTDKVVRAFYFPLHWLGNFTTSGCVVGRLTCAPKITRLTLN